MSLDNLFIAESLEGSDWQLAYRPMSVSTKVFERRNAVNAWFAGRPVLLAQVDGQIFAMDAVCSHVGCALLTEVEGGVAVCPLHGARFDVRTGAMVAEPRVRPEAPCAQEENHAPLRTYPVRVHEGFLEIDMEGAGS